MAHLGVLSFVTIVCLSIRRSDSYNDFNNNYDGTLNFECASKKQAISSVYSVYDYEAKDRKFRIQCKDVPGVYGPRKCEHSINWENGLGGLLAFQCRSNMYIVGMKSKHNNVVEDRRWTFHCCGFNDFHLYDCEFTGRTNDYIRVQDFSVPDGKVIKGVISVHKSAAEDRIYIYNVCKVKKW
ncbi:hemagglutinin/amebocyte aggregation factor-like [Mercenaria mercenaria]|uniref:hemagglutinin/amebocyte aggregation factor-like n=1 Tax=Mercenaria mercenaria TaxID=6596 RepID=UPI00234E5A7C|nr:hemagglutinin/amebocyte aggregation factor-like [Mercenaria mercenaria]